MEDTDAGSTLAHQMLMELWQSPYIFPSGGLSAPPGVLKLCILVHGHWDAPKS
jgi:hypothetical protein